VKEKLVLGTIGVVWLSIGILSTWWLFRAPSPRSWIPDADAKEEPRTEPIKWAEPQAFFIWHEETKTLEIVDPDIRCCDVGLCWEVGP
jgi:hypothetical protein